MKIIGNYLLLNIVRIVLISFAVLFSVIGFILFIWFPEFRADLFK